MMGGRSFFLAVSRRRHSAAGASVGPESTILVCGERLLGGLGSGVSCTTTLTCLLAEFRGVCFTCACWGRGGSCCCSRAVSGEMSRVQWLPPSAGSRWTG